MNTTDPITTILKTETADLHTKAEKHPFQAALVQGRAGREGYIAYLEQMLCLHRVIDAALTRHADHPAINAVVTSEQHQAPYLEEDLRYFDTDPANAKPNAATTEACAWIDALDPIALLGAHYVLEGSNNGGKFIAMAVRKSMRLEADGTRYLDPYADNQRAVWAAFKANLEAQELTSEDKQTMLDAAKRMFTAIPDIFDHLPMPKLEVMTGSALKAGSHTHA